MYWLLSTINFSALTSNFYTTDMFRITYQIEFAGMFMIYIYTRPHMRSSNSTLKGTIKQKSKYIFHAATILLLCYTKK
jgi:hypothetical protein